MNNLKATALSIGTLNIQTGKTKWDWSIYDNPDNSVFLTDSGNLLYCVPGTFQIGDRVNIRNHDSNRYMTDVEVIAEFKTDKETVINGLLDHKYDYRKLRAFAKKRFNNKLRTSYSIKSVI